MKELPNQGKTARRSLSTPDSGWSGPIYFAAICCLQYGSAQNMTLWNAFFAIRSATSLASAVDPPKTTILVLWSSIGSLPSSFAFSTSSFATIPPQLEVSATTPDGIVMGVRHRAYQGCEGVQFHPESIMTEHGKQLLDNEQDLWLGAHEFAHQWWGNMVTCRDWNHFWLNEGVATFIAAAYLEHRFGRAAYLRGALLASGSVSGPRNAHLELRSSNVEGAELLASLAAAEEFRLAVHDRGRHAVAYAKSTDTIAELLAFLGAHRAALGLEESAVVASTRARANRLTNADHANIVRASRAADTQLRAIRRLESDGRLEHLAPELREIAALRARNPTLSLRELAQRLKPPATKAAAHRRLAKLQKLAER